MRCLYCGREIGALNLRRAGEFCSRDHRKNYGDRLNKALQRMAGPENPPAGVAGFAASWPAQNGCLLPSLHCWEPGKVYPLLPGLALPGMALGAVNAADPVEQDPPLCLRAMPGLPGLSVTVGTATFPAIKIPDTRMSKTRTTLRDPAHGGSVARRHYGRRVYCQADPSRHPDRLRTLRCTLRLESTPL